jgi:NAD(P)-dependent dehydrogenase (short-subunit alcohol dehydrogenase family)
MEHVWFVTGASAGLGRAVVKAVLARGDHVVAVARRLDRLEGLSAEYGSRVLPIRLDVNDRAEVHAAVQRSIEEFGQVDVLVNNAGSLVAGSLEEVDEAAFREQFETNVFAVHALTRAVLPGMRSRQSGTIVMISSEAGVVGQGGFAAYSSSKFAVEGMSEALREEVADFGIAVIIVEPGSMRTGFGSESLQDPADAAAAILSAVAAVDPPQRLVLTEASVGRVRDKLMNQLDELTPTSEVPGR